MRTSLPPRPLTRFIGRGRELTRLHAALRAHRLVTVCGPPGIGKTRLVTEALWARDVAPPRGRLAFCDATDANTCCDLRELVASALDSHARELGPTLLRDAGRTLLVIDNFEHLVDSSAAQIAEWLHHAPHARCLMTSRRRLGVEGERVVMLSVLPADGAALELLLDRIALLDDRPLDGRDRTALARITCLLEGLPLAIELAAARLRSISPDELVHELERGVTMRSPEFDRSPRRVSLEASIHLSFHRLTAKQQRALSMLTVLRGSFSATAAEAVAEIDPATLDALCDHSLVMRAVDRSTRTTHYRLLFCVKDHAARRLDAASRSEAEDRHSEYFLRSFRERVLEREIYFELATIRAEHANLVLVLDRALRRDPPRDLDRRWAIQAAILLEELGAAWGSRMRGRFDEAITFAGLRDIDANTRAIALAHRAVRLALRDGRAGPADSIEPALSEAVAPKVRVRVLVLASNFYVTRAEYERALPMLEEALARCVATGWRYMEGRVRTKLARVLHALGAREEAIRNLERAIALLSDTESRYGLVVALQSLGTSHLDAGRPELATELFERALELDEGVDSEVQRTVVSVRLGVAAWMTGRAGAARRLFEEAIERFESLHEPEGTVGPWTHLALVHAEAGDVRMTTRATIAAIEAMLKTGSRNLAARRRLLDAHVAYAHARAAQKAHGHDSSPAAAAYARARAAVEETRSAMDAASTPLDARGLAMLSAAMETWLRVPAAPITIDRAGAHFILPGGVTVDLEARRTLARVLEAIVAASVLAPGKAVEKHEIVARAWAGERMSSDSASSRVYVAVSTLRKLGLAEVLRTVEGGYLLDLSRVVIVGEGGSLMKPSARRTNRSRSSGARASKTT